MVKVTSFFIKASPVVLVLATLSSLVTSTPDSSGGHKKHKDAHVKPPQLIQAAIDAASPGDTIYVEAGTYPEQLLITKDGINLVGRDAIIVPPGTPVTNQCSGITNTTTEGVVRQAGICVFGADVVLGPYDGEHQKVISTGRYVRDVSISGFNISGFGSQIAIYGAKNARVERNILINDDQYGVLTAGSKNSVVKKNNIYSTAFAFIAICNDDVYGARVYDNTIAGVGIGICIATNGSDISHNTVDKACVGAFVDPYVRDVNVESNRIIGTGPLCVPFFGAFIYGIVVDGARGTDVRNNEVRDITASGSPGQLPVAGIVIFDDIQRFPGTVVVAFDTTIKNNKLSGNDLDILILSNGTDNVVRNNQCSTPSCGL